MRVKLIIALLLLSNFSVAMAQNPSAINVRQPELPRHAFEIGQLRLTVEKLTRNFLLFGPRILILIRLENPSDSAISFDPRLLSLINKGNYQVNMGRGQPLSLLTVLPGAFVKEAYFLSSPVHLPARLYYDGKELAVITK